MIDYPIYSSRVDVVRLYIRMFGLGANVQNVNFSSYTGSKHIPKNPKGSQKRLT